MRLEEFKQLVNIVLKESSPTLHIDVRKLLEEQIVTTNSDFLGARDLNKMEFCMLCQKEVLGKKFDIYILLLDRIKFYLGATRKFLHFSNKNQWIKTLSAMYQEMSVKEIDKSYKDFHPKEYKYIAALRNLRKRGINFEVNEKFIHIISPESAYGKLSNMVKEIGGVIFLQMLFAQLQFNHDSQRLVTPKSGNSPMLEFNIDLPFGYLLNLGLSHINSIPRTADALKYFNEVIELARDLCFVSFPVQPDTIWADIMGNNRTPLEYLRDMTYKHSVFEMPQISQGFVSAWVSFIVNYIPNIKIDTTLLPFNLQDYISLMNKITSSAEPTAFKDLQISDLSETEINILETISGERGDINKGFISPLDHDKVNYWKYPVVKNKDSYLIFPLSIGARSWIECLMTIMRRTSKVLDSELGKCMEKFIESELSNQGLSFSTGDYYFKEDDKEEQGECDIVVESSKGILLFELKKKPLTTKAKSGSIDNIVIDIASSLVSSQYQCFRTEYLLRRDSKLDLISQNGTYKLSLKEDQKIERVSLAHFTYGPMQDRTICHNILKIAFNNNFFIDPSNPILRSKSKKDIKQLHEKIKDVNDNFSKLKRWVEKNNNILKNGDYGNPNDPFFDSSFFDLDQLYFLIHQSRNNEELYNNITRNKYVTFGTQDFYTEYFLRKPKI